MKLTTPVIENDLFTIRKLLLINGIISFVLGVIAVSLDWKNAGSLILLVAVLIFYNLYWRNEKYKEYKKLYFEYLPSEKATEMLNYGSFEITDQHLIYKSKTTSENINWTDLLSYKLIDSKHILIKREIGTNLIISETEMDKSDFKIITELIKERVKKSSR